MPPAAPPALTKSQLTASPTAHTSQRSRHRKRKLLRPATSAEKHVCSLERERLQSQFREEEAFDSEVAAEIEAAPLVVVSSILKHRVWGRDAGSLRNVYVKLSFSDGRTTGQHFVPCEPLARSEVLAAYLDTPSGATLLKYVPAEDRAALAARREQLDRQAEQLAEQARQMQQPARSSGRRSGRGSGRLSEEEVAARVARAKAAGVDTDQLARGKLKALGEYLRSQGGCAALVRDWRVRIIMRESGETAGQLDAYYLPPDGGKMRSFAEVARHFGLESDRETKVN